MKTPKEKPINFGGQMVLALLAGKKHETRRPLRFQHIGEENIAVDNGEWVEGRRLVQNLYPVGLKLWVREALYKSESPLYESDGTSQHCCRYDADGLMAMEKDEHGNQTIPLWQWKVDCLPSIFMPRWCSRVALQVMGSRLDRLQNMTNEDAEREGFESLAAFRKYWDALYAKKPIYLSKNNPLVWVVGIKRI